jgi:tetratricopeptide (TPR) repeat protein
MWLNVRVRFLVCLVLLAACHAPRFDRATVLAKSQELRLAARWDEALRIVRPGETASRADRAALLVEQATIEREIGTYRDRRRTADAKRTLQTAAPLVDEPLTRAALLEAEGWILYGSAFRNEATFDDAMPRFQEALALRRAAGDRVGTVRSLFPIGLVHQFAGRLPEARRAFEEGHALASEQQLLVELGYFERHLAGLDDDAGEPTRAKEGFRRSLELRERAGHQWGVVFAELALADVEAKLGEKAAARARLGRALELAQTLDLPVGSARVLESRAELETGDTACRTLAEAAAAWVAYGDEEAAKAQREKCR